MTQSNRGVFIINLAMVIDVVMASGKHTTNAFEGGLLLAAASAFVMKEVERVYGQEAAAYAKATFLGSFEAHLEKIGSDKQAYGLDMRNPEGRVDVKPGEDFLKTIIMDGSKGNG